MSSTSFGLLFQPKRSTGIYCATKLYVLIPCIGAYIHAHAQVVQTCCPQRARSSSVFAFQPQAINTIAQDLSAELYRPSLLVF